MPPSSLPKRPRCDSPRAQEWSEHAQCRCHGCPVKIGPSMLASDLADLAGEAKRVVGAGADYLHLDVMDGVFVPNITWGPPVVQCLRKHVPDVFFDCHMMVSKPLEYVEPMAKAGGSQYTFHIEALKDPDAEVPELCLAIRKQEMQVGVALSPRTPVSALRAFAGIVDSVLVMTVEPGFGGQSFMPNMMPKVLALRTAHPRLDIGVDGGLGPATIDQAAKAGANMIVAGSAVFKPGADMREVMDGLRRSVRRYGHGEGAEEARPAEAKALAEARAALPVPGALAVAQAC